MPAGGLIHDNARQLNSLDQSEGAAVVRFSRCDWNGISQEVVERAHRELGNRVPLGRAGREGHPPGRDEQVNVAFGIPLSVSTSVTVT